MKIKKVEIQAFRVFDHVNNSTFDFMTESGEIADFVSIHAPNGFGKTSFYDAVEWAFTNKITRYDRRKGFNSDLAKSERANSIDDEGKRKHQLILRNKFSDLEEGFVNLYTTLGDIPYSRTIPKVSRGVPDYKFEDQKIDKGTEHFHEVMLSQEWIDAFLKEDNAEVRYEKFVSSFGDVSLNKKYKAVIDIINLNKARVKSLRTELKDLSVDNDIEYDSNLLTITNNEIKKINSLNGSFPLIKPSFSEEDDYLFINLIKDKLDELNKELQKNEVTLVKIDSVKSGSSQEQIGLKSYFNLKEKLVKNEFELKTLKELKDCFSKRLDKIIKIQEVKENVSLSLNQIAEYKSLINVIPQFDVIENKIKSINLEISAINRSIVEVKNSLEDEKDERKELNSKLKIENSALNKLQSIKSYIPDVFKVIKDNDDKLLKLGVKKSTNSKLLEIKLAGVEKDKRAILDVDNALKTIEKGIYSLDENVNFEFYGEKISVIKGQDIKLKFLSNNISRVNSEIKEIDSLNNELKELLDIGAKVIRGSEMSECPLCQNSYESYAELSDKVSKNPLLKNEIRKLVEERSEIQGEYDVLVDLRKINKSWLLNQLDDLLKKGEVSLNNNKAYLENLNASIESNEIEVDRIKLENEGLELSVDNIGKEEYLLSVANKISSKSIDFKRVEESLRLINLKITDNEGRLNLFEVQVDNAKVRAELLNKELNFQKIKTFSKDQSLSDEESYLNSLNTLVEGKLKDVNEYKVEAAKLSEDIEDLSKKLPSSDFSYYTDKIIEEEKCIRDISNELTVFEVFIKSIFKIKNDVNELDSVTLDMKLENRYQDCLTEILNVKSLKSKIERMERHKTNVIPFLKSEENRKNSERLVEEITFLDVIVQKELYDEKIKLSNFIDQQIESFFFQNLINSLYKKIDPHPRYNEISFECDFSQDKPKLNVFVLNNVNDNAIVPTLYFSTAQLNILSLSIFLAKALNTTDNEGEPIDCIFIDDPIQSMDSINILSTIDLFRSIVTNMGKQIILSTHDESFQNLLKKKMPEKLFKSKFVEFETFGKLKAN